MLNSILLKLPQLPLIKSLFVSLALIIAAAIALLITPTLHSVEHTPDFEIIIPQEFGEWKAVVDPYAQVSLSTGQNDLVNQIYDSVLMRTYVNSRGDRVMLALAYGREQKQDIKIHRPEVCYVAQGFKLISQKPNIIHIAEISKPISAQRLVMQNENRYEVVSYWVRLGDEYPKGGFSARLKILKEGLNGKILDGILVRVSIALNDDAGADNAYKIQEQFVSELVNNINPNNQNILVVK